MGEGTKANMNEREISLIDLVVEILLKWRIIIVLMVVGAVLFGGLSYVRSSNAIEAQKAKLQELEEKEAEEGEQSKYLLEEKLSETQINNVMSALMYEKLYNEKQEFAKNSVIMNIDPLNAPKTDITLLIKSEDLENTYNIQKIYEDIVGSAGLLEYLKKECELEYNPSELVYLERTSYGQMSGQDTVRLYTIHDDAKKCAEIAQCVVDYIVTQHDVLVDTLGEHEVVVLEQLSTTIMAESYLDEQKNLQNEINTYRANLAKLKDGFSDEEVDYYNYLSEAEGGSKIDVDESEADEQDEELSLETLGTPSVSIKLVIIGMILFAFAYVAVIFMIFILNNKLRSTDSLVEVYNLPQLGLVPANASKKKIFGFVDAWILSLRNRNKRSFTTEEAINMAAVAVKMAIKKTSNSEVYFVGCDINKQTEEVCRKMQSILSKDNIETKVLDNVLYDAEAMASLENAHCVVLVEKAGSTLYDEIAKELELLARQDITVLGGIVVE